jgi:integrase
VASFRETRYGWRAEVFRRRVRRSESGFRTKAAAVAWAGKVEAEIMAGVRGEIPNLTVLALFERYQRDVSEHKKGKRWEVVRLTALGRDRLAQVKLRQLDTPHVADWQQRRLKAVKAASVRRERNLLNNVFEIARKEWRWLSANPFVGVRRPKDGKARRRIATPAEIAKLTKRASPTLRRVIIWALETGMRAGEIAACKDVDGRIATLHDSKTGEGREVPLSAKALEVWGGGFGLTAGSISELFGRLCEDCAIEGLTFHDLRATAATRLANVLHPLQLAKMFGWKDLKHALVYYREATEDIAKLL